MGDGIEGECGTLLRETTVDGKLVGREGEGETELWGTEDGLSSEGVVAVVNAELTGVVAVVREETGGSVVGERVPIIGLVGRIVLSNIDVETDGVCWRVGVLGVVGVGDREDVENNDCSVDDGQGTGELRRLEVVCMGVTEERPVLCTVLKIAEVEAGRVVRAV